MPSSAQIFSLVLGSSLTAMAYADTITVDSKVDHVLLYQNQALIERRATLELKAGRHELLFANIPASTQANSVLFSAMGTEGMSVVSTDMAQIDMAQYPSGPMRVLQEQIIAQKQQLQMAKDQAAVIANQVFLLQKAQENLGSGDKILSLEELERFQQFSRLSYSQLMQENRSAQQNVEKQERELQILEAKYVDLSGQYGSQVQVYKVQVEVTKAGPQQLNLRYTTQDAMWQPSYKLNYDSKNESLELVYSAMIQQNTYENWDQVKLVLSTGTPIQAGEVPRVQPWYIAPQPKRIDYMADRPVAPMVTASAPESQEVLIANTKMSQQRNRVVSATIEGGVSASSFAIPGTVTISSGASVQNLVIAAMQEKVKPEYAFYPQYDNKIFVTVEGKNTQNYPLLGGNLETSFDGVVVANGQLNTLYPGQSFKQFVGQDQGISIKSEPLKQVAQTSGLISKSKVVQQDSQYTFTNGREEALKVKVYDRIPTSTDKQISVKLLEPGLASIVMDSLGRYEQKIIIPAKGEYVLKRSFTVEYPSDLLVNGF